MRSHHLLLLGMLAGACSTASQMPSPDGGQPDEDGSVEFTCFVQAPTSCPSPMPVFADVKPIVDKWCIGCHDGSMIDGPWPLTDYEHVASWADTIRPAMLECTMPPRDAGLPPMPAADRLVILQWLRCGFPR